MTTQTFRALAAAPLEPDEAIPEALFAPNSSTPTVYARRLWELRYFISESAKTRMTAQNYDTALGNVWLIAEPMAFVAVYWVMFTTIIPRSVDEVNFVLFLTAGRLTFGHHRMAVGAAANSLRQNAQLLENTNLPRMVVPLTSVTAALYDFTISAGSILVIALATGDPPNSLWIMILPLVMGQIMLNIGIGTLVSIGAARIRDLQTAIPTIMLILFYASGVIFPVESFIEDSEHREFWFTLLMLNPFYGYIKGFQFAIAGYEAGMPGIAMLSSIAWTLVLFPLGIWWFMRNERKFSSVRYENA